MFCSLDVRRINVKDVIAFIRQIDDKLWTVFSSAFTVAFHYIGIYMRLYNTSWQQHPSEYGEKLAHVHVVLAL